MKITVAVVGVGRQGICAAHDMASLPGVGRVVLVDRDPDRLFFAADRLKTLGVEAEILPREIPNDRDGLLEEALEGAQLVVSSVPFAAGPRVCAAAIEAGASVVDLGGNLEVSRRIHELGPRAAERGVIVAPDCGLMPGLGNTLAGDAIARLESQGYGGISTRILCGGLPQEAKNPLGYELVFSFDGLLNEYDGASLVLRGGELASDPTLADIEAFAHPRLGKLESATTSGGTSTAPETFRGRVREYTYRTVRYPGHFGFFRILKEVGAFAPEHRDAVRSWLEPAIAVREPRDLVFLRVEATAEGGESWSREILDFRDEKTGFTAMERMTAFPAVCVLELAMEGHLRPGSVRVERDLPMEDYLSRLARRGIPVAAH